MRSKRGGKTDDERRMTKEKSKFDTRNLSSATRYRKSSPDKNGQETFAIQANDDLRRSLVITGFMGTGKTSAGRVVAQKLAREFVDMDEVLAAREGKTAPEIFESSGEEYFRARESELCAELGARDNLVIATGGGALVNSRNREVFANAFIICLDASFDAILARLNGVQDRPLLAQGNLRQRVEGLLKARQDAYAHIGRHLDTTDKSVDQVAAEILEIFKPAAN